MKVMLFTWRMAMFAMFYFYELVVSSLRVAHDVLTPRDRMRPGIVELPTRAETDLELTVLSSLITLTPGTLSVAVAPDRSRLFVHAMFIDGGDVEHVRRQLQVTIEARVIRLLRTFKRERGAAS